MKIKKEKIIRIIGNDPRTFIAMQNQRKNDTSFTGGGIFGIKPRYTQSEVREFWFQGMELGMEEGLRMGSLEGQKIDISTNCKNSRHKEFYQKFLQLSEEYNCAIAYYPHNGMCIIDLNKDETL